MIVEKPADTMALKASSQEKPNPKEPSLEERLNELAKRRGFFYMSNEIYGGLTGFYDYGSTGTLIKRNIENLWRRHFLGLGDNFFEIEPSDIMPEKVFIASGHIKNFIDPSVRCRKEGIYYRADHIVGSAIRQNVEGKSAEELSGLIREHRIRCPKCGGELGEVKVLNMMMPVRLGAEEDTLAYLRPETAQGVYVNFLRQFNIQRGRMPMGLAIIGRAFRNEISPRQLLIRQREFTQAELQIFFDPDRINEEERWGEVSGYPLRVLSAGKAEAATHTCEELAEAGLPKFYVYHMAKMQQFFIDILGLPEEKLRLRELSKEEKAFYNKIHFDVEVYLESLREYKEIGGVHYRTDHDLTGHQEVSKKSQEIFFNDKRFVPHVLELSAGIDRTFYAVMELSYREASGKREWEWFAFQPKVAPFQFAVYPLVSKDNVPEAAERAFKELRQKYAAIYDDSGSIGRRYARADEIGVPFSITADYETLKDDSVTIRERDSMEQVRVGMDELGKEAERLVEGRKQKNQTKTKG